MLRQMWQQTLCEAIANKRLVELRYQRDLLNRTFAPHAVYRTTKDNLCVAGTQLVNANKPLDGRNEPRNFELDEIRDLRVTDDCFTPDSRFDRFDPKYKNGIICCIEIH